MLLINNISGPKAMNGYKHRKLSLNSFAVDYKENKHIRLTYFLGASIHALLEIRTGLF